MALLVFFVGLATAMILDRQAKRQVEGIQRACERFGVEAPPTKPRLPRLEASLNIFIGISLALFGALTLVLSIMLSEQSREIDVGWAAAMLIGTGLAMTVVGFRTLREWKLQSEP
jgi:hypothetical protein